MALTCRHVTLKIPEARRQRRASVTFTFTLYSIILMPPRLNTSRALSFQSLNSAYRSQRIAKCRTLSTSTSKPACSGKRKSYPFSTTGPSVCIGSCVCLRPLFSSLQRAFHASAVHAAQKDPYQVLGVKKDASAADIKKTYFSVCGTFASMTLLSHTISPACPQVSS